MRLVLVTLLFSMGLSCNSQQLNTIQVGADQIERLLPLIEGKRIALVANHTSMTGDIHLVDTLLSYADTFFIFSKVFVPEHGFRGNEDAGASIGNAIDPVSGLPLISLYGSNKKPTVEQMADLDVVVFDIQDIGVRFYTYISTLHYVMEACAENQVALIILDRPNPNGNYIDGPILEKAHQSFVGMHPIPVVYGLTIGELACMINGEGWLTNKIKCNLTVVPCINYNHQLEYILPVKPSPNLPNQHSIRLYPSTCFFEGTVISEGRGTYNPFELFGHPQLQGSFSFTPVSIKGMSQYPKHMNKECFGTDLRGFVPDEGWTRLYLNWLIETYQAFDDKEAFFLPFFEKLAGTDNLRIQIQDGWKEEQIRESWQPGLEAYRKVRQKYLLYE